jgi:regulator of sigma E protease
MQSPGFGLTILAFLLVIGPLVFIHEMGHYLVGRLFGVKADAFSIGFGRELFGWTDKRGTRWKVGWLPLGGYVKFAGDMNPASTPSQEWLMLPPEERARTFQAKPVWQRFLIVLAGPVTNLMFAVVVYIAVFASYGQARTPAIVEGVVAGSPAAQAGLKPGDQVLAVNGNSIARFEDLVRYVQIRPGREMELSVRRGGETIGLTTRAAAETVKDEFGNQGKIGRLGIDGGNVRMVERMPAGEVVGAAFRQTGQVVQMMVVTLGQVFVGERSLKEMGGPIKIAQYSGQQAVAGWFNFVMFMTLISINLGFINLLPIPLLDGGHLLFYTIEGVRRKPLKPEAQEWAFRTGLALLLALMIFVTLNDLASFGLWSKLGGLIG